MAFRPPAVTGTHYLSNDRGAGTNPVYEWGKAWSVFHVMKRVTKCAAWLSSQRQRSRCLDRCLFDGRCRSCNTDKG